MSAPEPCAFCSAGFHPEGPLCKVCREFLGVDIKRIPREFNVAAEEAARRLFSVPDWSTENGRERER